MCLVWFPFIWGLTVKFCCLVAVFKSITFAGFFIFLSTWACQLCWLRSFVVTVLSTEQCKKHPHSVLQLSLAEQSSCASHKDSGRCHSPSDLILRTLVVVSAHPWHVLSQTPAFSFSSFFRRTWPAPGHPLIAVFLLSAFAEHDSDSDSELSLDEHSSSYASSHSSDSEEDGLEPEKKWNTSTAKNNERGPLHSTPKGTPDARGEQWFYFLQNSF